MKRVGFLYDKISNIDNIKLAIHKASKGKLKNKNISKIVDNIDQYSLKIQYLLKEKKYIPSPYIEDKLNDGISGKVRTIYKPRFYPDQIIHWCLMLVISPILMKSMYQYSCASIPKRGVIYAQNACEKWIRKDIKNTKYCLKMDITKFYPNINKEILKDKFRKKIKDQEVLELIYLIINSHNKGLPIGNYTSQWFANFYLQDADYFIKQSLGIKYYIRYMDDLCLFGPNKKKLHQAKISLDGFFKKHSLSIKDNWQVFKISKRPLDFVGYVFCRDKTTIRKSISRRIRRKCVKFKANPSKHNSMSLISYYGWVKHSDSYRFYIKNFKDNNIGRKDMLKLIKE